MAATKGALVTVFGGSGFVGRHVVRALAKRGYRVRAAMRRPDLAGALQPMGVVGQVTATQANLRYPDSIVRALIGADAVVNLVGILSESGKQTFDAVQAEGVAAVAKAAREAGVTRFVQMSAIGADETSDSDYARTKGAGEAAVRSAIPGAVILRPSIIFGPGDSFFNRFAAMARISPVLPLISGDTKFQPVFVGDVAEFIARAIDGTIEEAKTYEIGGPEQKTFRELLEQMLKVIGRRRLLLPVPDAVATLQAQVLEMLPKPMLTVDQLRQLRRDNVVSAAAVAERRTLEGAGIQPTAMDAVLPTYLWRFRRAGQFETLKAR